MSAPTRLLLFASIAAYAMALVLPIIPGVGPTIHGWECLGVWGVWPWWGNPLLVISWLVLVKWWAPALLFSFGAACIAVAFAVVTRLQGFEIGIYFWFGSITLAVIAAISQGFGSRQSQAAASTAPNA